MSGITLVLTSLCIKISEISDKDERKRMMKLLKIKIHYHLFVNQIKIPKNKPDDNESKKDKNEKMKKDKNKFQAIDAFNVARSEIRSNPLEYCNRIYHDHESCLNRSPTRNEFNNLIKFINNGEIKKNQLNPIMSSKSKKRKQPSVMNYALQTEYWFEKMPQKYIDKIKSEGMCLHNDHIIPFSTRTKERITLDRLGNFSPIMANLNCKRGCGHISTYYDNEDVAKMLHYLNIFPSEDEYDKIVRYEKSGSNKVPYLINKKSYNEFCSANEERYISTFLNRLYQ